ncbi:MAG: transcription termination/antitermination factor NusG [Atopobiaceae bacterium]|nr:transcription termination/antitermination factor NusG [Atopobiaceae bacterium]
MAKRWYVVHTYSGYENKVKADLEHRIETYGVSDLIVDIQIPVEKVIEIKDGGQRETKESKVFPGYVLIRMELNDDTWSIVRNTAGVTGFVGSDGTASPLSRAEYRKIMGRGHGKDGRPSAPKPVTNIQVGQHIRVNSGPLSEIDSEGVVTEVNPEANKVKALIEFFGRETSVELTIDQVTVIN